MSLTLRDSQPRREMPGLQPGMGAGEFLTLAFRQRGNIVAALIIPPVIALLLVFFVIPKVYRAQSDILVKSGREYLAASENGGAAGGGPTSTLQEDITSEISLLTSRAVARETINAIGIAKMYPDLIDTPPKNMTIEDAAIELFSGELGADPVKMSNVITTTFDARSPALAEEILNKTIQVYIAKHTEVFSGSRATGFEEGMKTTLAELDRLEGERTRIKVDNGIYDIGAQRNALITQKVNAQGHLQDIIDNQSTLTKRLAYLKSIRSSLPTAMQTTNVDKSDEAVHAREALIDLQSKAADLSAHYGEGYPDLRRIRSQIATLQSTLASTASSRTATVNAPSPLRQQVEQEIVMDEAQLSPLDAERTRYEALVASITSELQRIETADLALRTTSSRVEALQDNLKALQDRFAQARTQEQTEIAKQVSVVQTAPANAPSKAAKPKKIIWLGVGLMLGILAAGTIIVLSMLFNKTVVTEDAAERLLGLPVLVSMPLRSRKAGPLTLEME